MPVRAGRHGRHRNVDESHRLRQQPQLAGGETRGPEIELTIHSGLIAHRGAFVEHSGAGIEGLARLQVSHHEVRRERGQREPTAGPECTCQAGDDRGVIVTSEQPESALAETDHRVELTVVRERTNVGYMKPSGQCLGGRPAGGQIDEVGGEVDADHFDATPGQSQCVTTRTAADVKDPPAGCELEGIHEKAHFLLGAGREGLDSGRVRRPVRSADERGEFVEPGAIGRV